MIRTKTCIFLCRQTQQRVEKVEIVDIRRMVSLHSFQKDGSSGRLSSSM